MTNVPNRDPDGLQESWTLAVDLGCAQLAAVVTNGSGHAQPLEFDSQLSMPGGVWMDSDGHFVVGNAASRQALLAPHRWEPAPVRLLGSPEPRILAGAGFDPRDAVAQILRHVLDVATERLGRSPARTVLVHPEGWPVERQQALTGAAHRAGIDEVELLGTAHAAGRYLYGARLLSPGAIVGVVDVGAGSVGTAVIHSTDDGLEVLGAAWSGELGGNSLDLAIFDRVVRSVLSMRDPRLEERLLRPADARWRRLRETLLREVRRAREELTRHGTVRVHTDAVADASLELTRHDLDLLIRPQIDQMVDQLKDSLTASGIAAHRLDGVALFGGAAATPLLARAIVSGVGQVPRLVPDPQLALAFGGVTRAPVDARMPVPAGRPGALSTARGGPSKRAGSASTGPIVLPGPPVAAAVISPRFSDASPAGGITAIPVRTPPANLAGPPEQPPADLPKPLEPPDWDEPEDGDREDVAATEDVVAENVAEPEVAAEPEEAAEPEVAAEPEEAAEPEAVASQDAPTEDVQDTGDVQVAPEAEAAVTVPVPVSATEPETVAVQAEPDLDEADAAPSDGDATAATETADDGTADDGTAAGETAADETEVDAAGPTVPIPEPAALAVPDPASLVPPHVARKMAAQTGPIPVITTSDPAPATSSATVPAMPAAAAPALVTAVAAAPEAPAEPLSVQPATQRRLPRPRAWIVVVAIMALALLAGVTAVVIRPSGSSRDSASRSPSALPLVPTPAGSAAASPSPSASASASADDRWAAWGEDAVLARTWSAVVPVTPAMTGSQGQQCSAVPADSPFSIHKIICTYANGVRLTLLQYNTEAKRNDREHQIAAMDGVRRQDLEIHDLEGDLITGTFYAQDKGSVWRWWALDGEVHSAVYTRWPSHNAAQLQTWWDDNAPFT